MVTREFAVTDLFPVRRVLGSDGSLVGPEPDFLSADQLREIYKWMVFLRTHDQRCLNLQRTGRMGTFAPFSGQEACQVGSAYLLQPKDWVFPTYRDHGAMMVHGVPEINIMRYFMGDEWGGQAPPGVNVFPISIPIATQLVHAMGVAWAAKIRGDDAVAVGYAGDGGTSPGDFHEALNFAAVYNVGSIFFIQNNRYAISVPIAKQMKNQTIAQRALGYDIPGVRVDGQDVLAVLTVMHEAIARARSGGGPTLVEALTYRYGPHTTSDDPKRYRKQEEVEAWQQADPILKFRAYLERKGLWHQGWEDELTAWAREEVNTAAAAAEAMGRPRWEDMFDHLYAELPPLLREQKEKLARELARRSGEVKHHG